MAEYAEPLGLKKRKGSDLYRIAILNSRGMYDEFARALEAGSLHSTLAHFDPVMQLAVTYEDPFRPDGRSGERRHSLLHEFVHALQYAYYNGYGLMPKPQWFCEGLAEYRSKATNVASSLRHPRFPVDDAWVGVWIAANDPRVSSLKDLVSYDGPGYGAVVAAARKRIGGRGDAEYDHHALSAFYAQSTLLAFFLHDAEEKKWRKPFDDYMQRVMKGDSGWATFEAAFGDGAAVETAFKKWVLEECGKHYEIGPAARAAIDAASGGGSLPKAKFDHAKLALGPEQWKIPLAAALAIARKGDYASAAELAAAIEGSSG